MKYYYVYILKCSDNSYYTGFTNNLDRRLAEHIE
ncbi:MAG: GIY-YIG nuclease family protein [Bacteroidales bacterium]|nr:GIY-YIG nuclease family protein [Bacteroidales bacterium]MBN2819775.1 GIY-YIG nuclease family protein [Bacteroidales bacterium]